MPQIDAGSTTDQIEMHFGAHAGGLETPSDVWSAYSWVVVVRGRNTLGATKDCSSG